MRGVPAAAPVPRDGFGAATGMPSTLIDPASGRSSAQISRASVLFPAPFSPMIATISPWPTDNDRSLIAGEGASG